jgi:hypothetical protein
MIIAFPDTNRGVYTNATKSHFIKIKHLLFLLKKKKKTKQTNKNMHAQPINAHMLRGKKIDEKKVTLYEFDPNQKCQLALNKLDHCLSATFTFGYNTHTT